MLLHEFRPGGCWQGATALAVAALYAADADGALDVPWYTVFPLLSGGLLLAAAAAGIAYRLRLRTRRRSASSASADSTGAPASTSGSQAMR